MPNLISSNPTHLLSVLLSLTAAGAGCAGGDNGGGGNEPSSAPAITYYHNGETQINPSNFVKTGTSVYLVGYKPDVEYLFDNEAKLLEWAQKENTEKAQELITKYGDLNAMRAAAVEAGVTDEQGLTEFYTNWDANSLKAKGAKITPFAAYTSWERLWSFTSYQGSALPTSYTIQDVYAPFYYGYYAARRVPVAALNGSWTNNIASVQNIGSSGCPASTCNVSTSLGNLTMYDGANYSGASIIAYSSTHNYASLGGFNDRTSSYR